MKTLLLGLGLLSLAQSFAYAIPTLYTVGDSTVQIWAPGFFPKEGWGQVLPFFFDTTKVAIVDKGAGGTSSKSYYENQWPAVRSLLKAGDYVTIQFGINDSAADVARHTVPETTFKDFLTKFCNETKAKGAIPILISTLNRSSWETDGVTIHPAYHGYPIATRELAPAIGVPLIDLDKLCTTFLQAQGQNYSTHICYMTFPGGLWPNYPTGQADTVHLQLSGATEMAKLVVLGWNNVGGIANSTDANVRKLIPFIRARNTVTITRNNANGIVTRTGTYPPGLTVQITALPNPGHSFINWTGAVTGTKSSMVFTMGSSPLTINANFN